MYYYNGAYYRLKSELVAAGGSVGGKAAGSPAKKRGRPSGSVKPRSQGNLPVKKKVAKKAAKKSAK